jgi:RNA polymerase sigma factor (sigma-70 family)
LAQKQHISQIVKDYGNRLKGFIRKRVHSNEDAEDILQDVFYQLAEADQMMQPIEQVSAWLYSVARNRITDLYRKKRPSLLPEISGDDDSVAEMVDFLVGDDGTPEMEYLKNMIWEELEKALLMLPEEQRFVFEMNEMKGIPFKELAKQSGESVNTLISRKRYAVIFLRQHLQNLYNELLNL